MHIKLEKIYQALENQRLELNTHLQSFTTEQLQAKPTASSWSALQVVAHLYTAEKLSFSYIKKKSLGIADVGNAGLRQTMLMPILKLSQRLPFRFKAPKAVVENTPEAIPLEHLIDHWNLLRLELKAHLENLPDAHMNKLVYKHPVAGRLSLPQAMQFFAEHINHHKPQIKRALKS